MFIIPPHSQRLRPTIHETITSKIKAHAELVNSSRCGVGQTAQTAPPGVHFMKGQLESYHLAKLKRQNGMSLSGALVAVSPVSPVMAPLGKAQATTKELLDSILDTVVRIFGQRNYILFLFPFHWFLDVDTNFRGMDVQRIMLLLGRFLNQNLPNLMHQSLCQSMQTGILILKHLKLLEATALDFP